MILDTFVSIFTADATDLKKGYAETKKGADNVTDALKDTEHQAAKTGSTLLDMAKKAAGFLATAALARAAISGAVGKSEEIHLFNQTVESIKENVQAVDALKRSMEDNGVSGEAVMGSLTNLFRASGRAAADAGSAQAKAFSTMGVSVRDVNGGMRGSVELMSELAGAAESLGAEQATSYFQRLGITDQRVIETLLKGRKELDENVRSHKELSVITKKSIDVAAKYDTAMNKLTHAQSRGWTVLSEIVTPIITLFVDKLGDLVGWMVKNKTFVTGFFIAVAGALLVAFTPAMVTAAIATWALIAPLLLAAAPLIALMALFALLYDDVMHFKAGNDSLIGQIMEKYPALGKIITAVFGVMGKVMSEVALTAEWFAYHIGMAFTGGAKALKGFIGLLLGAVNTVAEWGLDFKNIFTGVADDIKGVFESLWAFISEWIGKLGAEIGKISGPIKKVAGFFGIRTGESTGEPMGGKLPEGDYSDIPVIEQVNAANVQLNQATANPLNSTTSNAISNSSNVTNENVLTIGEIKIETQATDAKGVASGVSSELRDQIRNLQMESATGIAR